MSGRQVSRRRTFAGLVLAVLAAPVVTALCIGGEVLVLPGRPAGGLSDAIEGTLTFLVLALVFGSVLAAIPGLLFGGLAIAIARSIGTRSPVFYAIAGLVAGALIALLDTGRTKSAFVLSEAAPFVVGGCLSALTYWAVAER